MAVADVLHPSRICVASDVAGLVRDKQSALEHLSTMLAGAEDRLEPVAILRALSEREQLQSTGVGGGVAVPHGSVAELREQRGAVLICPTPIEFDAIDGAPVSILFALVGPKGAPAEHLKILARMSRLLRQASFREQLLGATTGQAAYQLICEAERGGA